MRDGTKNSNLDPHGTLKESMASPASSPSPSIRSSPSPPAVTSQSYPSPTNSSQDFAGCHKASPSPSMEEEPPSLPRIRVADILPEDAAASEAYDRAAYDLSGCLARHGAAILELSTDDSAFVRCVLESAKLFFQSREHDSSAGLHLAAAEQPNFVGYATSASTDTYYFRAGRKLPKQEVEHPPCMPDVFRCLGKSSRIVLGAISRKLRLRSDIFYPLLDDCPLPDEDISASVLIASHLHSAQISAIDSSSREGCSQEFEKGLLTLIAADSPGLQVCDTNGCWYLADIGLRAGDLLLLTGRVLQYITAGHCPASPHRLLTFSSEAVAGCFGRTSLTFRLMPRGDATLDGSVMRSAGYAVSEWFRPILASKFIKCLSAASVRDNSEMVLDSKGRLDSEVTLRRALSDPMTGTILEDACTALRCRHSVGGGTLRKATDTIDGQGFERCDTCGADVDVGRVIPNLALRAAAVAFKREERRRRMKIASRKRRKEFVLLDERIKRLKGIARSSRKYRKPSQVRADVNGVQYSLKVNERVLIKGNKRTPEKLVGKEAVVTSKCLNGWYLVRLLDNGESVRLQFRSLQRCKTEPNVSTSHSTGPQKSSPVND